MPRKTKMAKSKTEKIETEHNLPYQKQMVERKLEEKKLEKPIEKSENKIDEINKSKIDNKKKNRKIEKGLKKTEAIVNGRDVGISTKQAIAICKFIKNKNIEEAINKLEEVKKMKIAIPMQGEIPHRKGKIMSGRYPINAVKEFLILLKSLKSNAINHELELEKVKLTCMANVASRPMKRFGRGQHKRSHVQIKLVPIEVKK